MQSYAARELTFAKPSRMCARTQKRSARHVAVSTEVR